MAQLSYSGGTPVRNKPFPSWPKAGKKEITFLEEVLKGTKWFSGPLGNDEQSFCSIFAEKFAQFHGAEYAQMCANGSVAIELALQAAGMDHGQKVIVPSYTFISTATSVLKTGGIPVFADIDPSDYCISVSDIENKIDRETVGIIPVHLGGHPCEMDKIREIARINNLFLIEDCAQAIGTTFEGRKVGTFGDVGTFSFQSNKTITSGEGGLVLTNDRSLWEKLSAFCSFGRKKGQSHERSSAYKSYLLSSNYRLSEFQAAVLLGQYEKFFDEDAKRQANADYLTRQIQSIPGIRPVKKENKNFHHGYYYYVISVDTGLFGGLEVDTIAGMLKAEGIPFITGDDIPIYKHPVFHPDNLKRIVCNDTLERYRGHAANNNPVCPNAENACKTTLILRHNILLGEKQDMDDIVEALAKVQKLTENMK